MSMSGLRLFRDIIRERVFGHSVTRNPKIGENGGVFQKMVLNLDISIS